jgi:hypothetical protein
MVEEESRFLADLLATQTLHRPLMDAALLLVERRRLELATVDGMKEQMRALAAQVEELAASHMRVAEVQERCTTMEAILKRLEAASNQLPEVIAQRDQLSRRVNQLVATMGPKTVLFEIRLHRFKQDYEGRHLKVWGEGLLSSYGDVTECPDMAFEPCDPFGRVATIAVATPEKTIHLRIHRNGRADPGGLISLVPAEFHRGAWLIQGVRQAFKSKQAASKALRQLGKAP